jgi:hypothetical protein
MQESVQHIIPTGDLLDSHKATISRKSNFGDLLISKDEIVELFFEGNNRDFLRITNNSPIRAIHSPIHGKPAYILREVIPIVKNFYREQGTHLLA